MLQRLRPTLSLTHPTTLPLPLLQTSPKPPPPPPPLPHPTTLRAHLKNGHLLPTTLITPLIHHHLHLSHSAGGYILDGYPRTLSQAHTLLSNFGSDTQEVDLRPEMLLVLKCEDEEVLRRRLIGRGRADDKVEVVERRIRGWREVEKEVVGILGEGVEGLGGVVRVVEAGSGRGKLMRRVEEVVDKGVRRICVVGAPGSGKGVVGGVLAERGLKEVGVGEVLRSLIRLEEEEESEVMEGSG